MSRKITYNLVRQVADDFKKEKPEAVLKQIPNRKTGGTALVPDFECFYKDYPYLCGTYFYDYTSPHALDPDMPFIVVKENLWAVKGFIQVSEDEVNIHCVYCGDAKDLPMAQSFK